MNDVIAYSAEERKARKSLGNLIASVRVFEEQMDALFSDHDMDTVERGKKVANLLNALALVNDQCLYFGLGFDFRRDIKRPNSKAIMKWASKTTKEIK